MKKIVVAAAAVVTVGVIAVAAWLAFGGDDERTARDTCGSASYELAVEREDSALEVTFELQSTSAGETWDVIVAQDGSTLLQGERQTDEDAELDVDVIAQESDGETFTVTATPAEGEACTAEVDRG